MSSGTEAVSEAADCHPPWAMPGRAPFSRVRTKALSPNLGRLCLLHPQKDLPLAAALPSRRMVPWSPTPHPGPFAMIYRWPNPRQMLHMRGRCCQFAAAGGAPQRSTCLSPSLGLRPWEERQPLGAPCSFQSPSAPKLAISAVLRDGDSDAVERALGPGHPLP